jgi:putative tryptophan/tyrosine transport system substrate-binding protein
MRRRELITFLGGAAVFGTRAAHAQQAMPVVGYLHTNPAENSGHNLVAFLQGLRESGFTEGQNVAIEYRWANNEPQRLPALAADLVRRRVAVIVAPGASEGVRAAMAATTTIPIVFRTGGDPVALGLVPSLNRPGGNVTGVNQMSLEIVTKRVGLLHDLAPAAKRLAVLFNPSDPNAGPYIKELQASASALGLQIEFFGARNNHEIDGAFVAMMKKRSEALLVVSQGLLINRRVQIVTHATRHGLPGSYPNRDFTEIGGLMSYGPNGLDQYRLTGVYTGRVLKGEKPADMPILRATKFDFVLNLQTAKILGIEIPASLLAGADEVIE